MSSRIGRGATKISCVGHEKKRSNTATVSRMGADDGLGSALGSQSMSSAENLYLAIYFMGTCYEKYP